jgi:hypothetical protein
MDYAKYDLTGVLIACLSATSNDLKLVDEIYCGSPNYSRHELPRKLYFMSWPVTFKLLHEFNDNRTILAQWSLLCAVVVQTDAFCLFKF